MPARNDNIKEARSIFDPLYSNYSTSKDLSNEVIGQQIKELIRGSVDEEYNIINEPFEIINSEEVVCPALRSGTRRSSLARFFSYIMGLWQPTPNDN